MERTRAFRRHQVRRHLTRRLKEHRNQHYRDVLCACWVSPRAVARFKEQPQSCSCMGCCNQRDIEGASIAERQAGACGWDEEK
jgi:hypothetical protein